MMGTSSIASNSSKSPQMLSMIASNAGSGFAERRDGIGVRHAGQHFLSPFRCACSMHSLQKRCMQGTTILASRTRHMQITHLAHSVITLRRSASNLCNKRCSLLAQLLDATTHTQTEASKIESSAVFPHQWPIEILFPESGCPEHATGWFCVLIPRGEASIIPCLVSRRVGAAGWQRAHSHYK